MTAEVGCGPSSLGSVIRSPSGGIGLFRGDAIGHIVIRARARDEPVALDRVDASVLGEGQPWVCSTK